MDGIFWALTTGEKDISSEGPEKGFGIESQVYTSTLLPAQTQPS